MFEANRRTSTFSLWLNLLEVTYHSSARKVRKNHRNAVLAIVLQVFQSLLFIAAFYVMFSVLGMRGSAIRGDFMLYLLTGIYAYLTHIQAIRQIMSAESPTSPMMQHAPMNTLVAILSSAISSLYTQVVSLLVLLLILHTLFTPLEFYYWPGALLMFLMAWGSGCVFGLILLALKPWAPDVVNIIQLVYIRASMIASGKMFVANALPGFMIGYFDWNPLFHIIDQARGFTFVNYFPHYTSWQYPFYFTVAAFVLAMMAEFYTRKHASASWDAAR